MNNDEYLPDFTKDLIEKMRVAEYEKKETFRKNLPSFIWTGIVAVIEIAVVLAIFNGLYGSEVIFMASIVILYTYIRSIGTSLFLQMQVQGLGLANEIYQIKKKLEIPQDEESFEKIKDGNKLYRKLETNKIIQSIGLLVLFVIALWQIFEALQ